MYSTGADVNLKNNGGRTALHYAASKGRLKIAEALISHGAKLNLKDKVCKLQTTILFSLFNCFSKGFSFSFTFQIKSIYAVIIYMF